MIHSKYTVAIVFGTRPEFIKLVALIFKIKALGFNVISINTGQHSEMLNSLMRFYDFEADYNLNLMSSSESLHDLYSQVIKEIGDIVQGVQLDLVIVHGDTASAAGAAFACFLNKTPVVHVEAGLRSNDIHNPFPEEINRIVISQLTSLHLCPTLRARNNLIGEGVKDSSVHVTGNTVIDSMFMTLKMIQESSDVFSSISESLTRRVGFDFTEEKYIIFTCHRREVLGPSMLGIFEALRRVAEKRSDIRIVFPVHRNPKVINAATLIFEGVSGVVVCDPPDYPEFLLLLKHCVGVITDSGGIQEEAPSLGKPVLVTRDTTERPEAVESGTVILVGSDKNKIVSTVNKLLNDDIFYSEMSNKINPYGDGNASERILEFINENL